VVVRDPPRLLPLAAGVAVAEAAGGQARLKWPNDVLIDGRKVAGILVEGRPRDGWAVVGMGINVAVRLDELPAELQDRAGTLGLAPDALEPTLERLMAGLETWTAASSDQVLGAVRSRDALRGRQVRWADGEGQAAGIDGDGRLIVITADGQVGLEAGEVHLVAT
jgi:BirA family biotin operon repressor/biotin-[acetyl-CoA-carboxylase] ligase